MNISPTTRQDILDAIAIEGVYLAGGLNPVDFLNRIYDLKQMPSNDPRFKDAESDIWQHCVNNDDYEMYWVFHDSRFNLLRTNDEIFLRFLCEMLHPLVRNNQEQVELLKNHFNECLRKNGFELVERTRIAGRPVFTARQFPQFGNATLEAVRNEFGGTDASYIMQQITRMEVSINEDPDLAIGTAKELIETCCKTILKERQIEISKNPDLGQLVKQTAQTLALTPGDISDKAKASDTIRKILSNLTAIAQGIDELRNHYGTGHGKTVETKGLKARHARLAVSAASTLVIFLYETHKIRNKIERLHD